MKKNKKIFLALILLMGIGFASVATTLYVNGTATIANADFDVIFTKASLDGNDISSTAISDGGTVITYTTSDLNSVGDQSVLNFTVKNNSPMYDATVSINCTANGENSEYYTVSELIDGESSATVESMHTKDGTITVALSQVSTETISEEFTCTINASAVERTTVGEAPTQTEFHPIYFAFDAGDESEGLYMGWEGEEDYEVTLSTSSPTTPPPIAGHRVFLGMDAEGNKGICMYTHVGLSCFQADNYEYELQHIMSIADIHGQCYSGPTCYYGTSVDDNLPEDFGGTEYAEVSIHENGSVFIMGTGRDWNCWLGRNYEDSEITGGCGNG